MDQGSTHSTSSQSAELLFTRADLARAGQRQMSCLIRGSLYVPAVICHSWKECIALGFSQGLGGVHGYNVFSFSQEAELNRESWSESALGAALAFSCFLSPVV